MTYIDKTRFAYDVVAADYAKLLGGYLADSTWDRAVLGAFAEVVDGPVLEVGCGPGRITGPLAALGVQVSGIDLSPQMIEVARREHPHLTFNVGSLLDLDQPDASLGGLVAWYSLVHTPRTLLPAAFAEFFRVLRPGGHLLIAFKATTEPVTETATVTEPATAATATATEPATAATAITTEPATAATATAGAELGGNVSGRAGEATFAPTADGVLTDGAAGVVARQITHAYGHDIELDVYWYPAQLLVDLLVEAGFVESMRLVRVAEDWEGQPQAYVLGVKP